MAFWCKFFMSDLILDFGSLSLLDLITKYQSPRGFFLVKI